MVERFIRCYRYNNIKTYPKPIFLENRKGLKRPSFFTFLENSSMAKNPSMHFLYKIPKASHRHSMACSFITPICASVFTWQFLYVCLCISLFLREDPSFNLELTLIQVNLTLTLFHLQRNYFQTHSQVPDGHKFWETQFNKRLASIMQIESCFLV